MQQLKSLILKTIPRSFGKRIGLLFVSLAFFTMLINIVVIFFFEYTSYLRHVEFGIESQFSIMEKDLSEAIITEDIYTLYTMVEEVSKNIDHIDNILVLGADGSYITDAHVRRKAPGNKAGLIKIDKQIVAGSRPLGSIVFYIDKSSILTEVMVKVGYLAMLNTVIILLGALAGLYLSRMLTKPLTDLSSQLSSIDVLELPYKLAIPEYSSFETSQLKEMIEGLSERLKDSLEKISQQQKEMSRSERLAYLGTMSAGLAHELKNPIMSISLILDSMVQDKTEDPQFLNDYKMMKSQAEKLVYRINEFLEYSKPMKIEKTLFGLFDLAQEIKRQSLSEVSGEPEIDFQMPENSKVFSDIGKLVQMFQILLHNSAEAGADRVFVSASVTDGTLNIDYRDNGRGFAGTDVSKIMLPFYTTKKSGVGLGLAICSTILDALAGHMDADTQYGGGARFTLSIPV